MNSTETSEVCNRPSTPTSLSVRGKTGQKGENESIVNGSHVKGRRGSRLGIGDMSYQGPLDTDLPNSK